MSTQNEPDMIDRARGALLGLAVGDALGATVEFKSPGSFDPVTDMIGGGPHQLQPGQWTDDTSMALCLAESLVECDGFDATDQMQRYVRWYRDGYMSSTGSCFDIGNTTAAALHRFERGAGPFAGSTDPHAAGNGSIMRLAPVPIFCHRDPRAAIRYAGDSSRTTHAAPETVDACRYMGGLIVGALRDTPRDTLLSARWSPVPGLWDEEPLAPRIDEVAAGSFLSKEPPQIRGSGYVVESLEAALWAFSRSSSFGEGLLLAVNLGDDADTTGAVYGQIAGAYYGASAIPAGWIEKLAMRELIEGLADRLAVQA
jgi:ADP-ribosyl-[dinitrogen reductase] hydrolase